MSTKANKIYGEKKCGSAMANTIMGTYKYWVEEDLPTALKYLEDAFKISEELNDVVSLFFSSG